MSLLRSAFRLMQLQKARRAPLDFQQRVTRLHQLTGTNKDVLNPTFKRDGDK